MNEQAQDIYDTLVWNFSKLKKLPIEEQNQVLQRFFQKVQKEMQAQEDHVNDHTLEKVNAD